MVEFFIFCIPALIYVFIQSHGKNRTWRSARSRIGLALGEVSAYKSTLVVLLPMLLVSWLATKLIPLDASAMPGVIIAQVTSVGAVLATVLRACGEEIFFRGLLGGIFIRRLGFLRGNLLQATVFLVPHLALLLVSSDLWIILPVQFVAGWLMGWLRYKTESIVPGAIVHSVVNIAAGLIALLP